MTWPMVFLESKPSYQDTKVGDYWLEDGQLVIALPSIYGTHDRFRPDNRWQITHNEQYENLTLHPSVRIGTSSPSGPIDIYHGWIQNGIMSDDIDGRNYG